MEQGSIDENLEPLEEWYTKYMTQNDPTAAHDASDSDSLDLLEAYEAEILQLTREIDVTDGFCSTCHTMLNNWPHLEARDPFQVAMADGNEEPRIYRYSPSTDLYPGAWIEHNNLVKYVLPFQGQIVRLEAASKNGCRFCGLALQAVKDDDRLVLYRLIERRLRRLGKPSKISLVVWSWKPPGDTSNTIELGFPGRLFQISHTFHPPTLFAVPDGKNSNLYEASRPFRGTSWQASTPQRSLMDIIERWTRNCLESHPDCNLERPRCYPSRLLSIAVDPIRLAITSQWTDRPLYATLSHCWGKVKFETLKTTNFDELQRGVPNRLLSKTFGDAIQIARAVGLKYLWIDSLCIIQDSSKDWEAEASTMATVYGGSSLNIAASSARDGSEGCFLQPLNHAGGFTARVCTDGKGDILEFSTGGTYYENFFHSHLATRAWTVQEKVLPPRTLHCGHRGLFWECRTQVASEYFPDGFTETNSFLRGTILRWYGSNLKAYWTQLKQWYSRCDLTHSEDKLIALSGVARVIQNKTGYQYFAGLWQQNLAQELCWSAMDPQQRPQYRAPSWSWAAVDGEVEFKPVDHNVDGICYVSVRSVSLIHPGGNILGAVTHGTLSLHCDMIICGTVVAEETARANRGICPTRHDRNPDQKPGACFVRLCQTGNMLVFLLDFAERKDSRVGQTIYYLPLRVIDFPDLHVRDEGTHKQVFGLVIEKSDTPLDQYRRIGSFQYYAPGWWANHHDGSGCSLSTDYVKFMELATGVSSSGGGGLIVNIV